MVSSIAATYTISIKDQSTGKVRILDDWIKLDIDERLDDIGSCTLVLSDIAENDSLFGLDNQIIVERSIPGVLDGYSEFETLHRRIKRTLDQDGRQTIESYSVGYNDFLARRVVAYKAGTIRATKNCSAETAIKEYVNENLAIASGLFTVVGRLSDGHMPGLSVQPDQTAVYESLGFVIPNWSGDKAYENLLDVIKEIANFANIDFSIVRSGEGLFVFETYVNQLGLDRTYTDVVTSTGKNKFGNAPVIFKAELGNVATANYEYAREGEANVVIVQGPGDASTKKTITVEYATAIDDSPWNIREVSRSSSPQGDDVTNQMIVFGKQTLKEMAAKETFDFEPLQTPSRLYGKHYKLGDRVTVQFGDISRNKRITAVKISVAAGSAEQISLEYTDIT
jgi:hypothetical protein